MSAAVAAGFSNLRHVWFFNFIPMADGFAKVGVMEEFGPSSQIFNSPKQESTRDYVAGLFGLELAETPCETCKNGSLP
ncbi:hypothetical protein [Synechococcus sp. CCY 0621]|uniref:hypothetical protein n=1 Tax=Synechococcus sp. CCY 0621 TaxID=2815603 RepID=UPI001C21EA1D|nr:hypothetical protein [Synechococcus sp. CCY 0621]